MGTIFTDGLPVRLIATPRAMLETCRSDEALPDVVERNTERFDYFPVLDASNTGGRIIGLIDLTDFHDSPAPDVSVEKLVQPITEKVLIGANASIIDFVKEADKTHCRLVVSGSQISGLVSLADLQKLPVRAALFAVVTQLEIVMAAAIRRAFAESEGWLDLLSQERRQKIRDEMAASRQDESFVESILFTQFADKVTVIKKHNDKLSSKRSFERDLDRAQRLRNALAHANDYAATRATAMEVCETVRMVELWIGSLSVWCAVEQTVGNET